MANTVVAFDSGELEIALVTYNRCEFVSEWLERCYEQIKKRNIKLSIYDSSTNDDTEKYIQVFKERVNDRSIEYYHLDSDINVGYKPMVPILNSKSKYIWISGDTRCQNFEDLDKKVFPHLKDDIDGAIFHILNNEENDGRLYTNKEEFLKDCFLSMTCIGLTIYKTSLFEPLKRDEQLSLECDQKYRNNYGFAWIGYFLEMVSIKECRILFSVVPVADIKAEKKVHTWFKRCYGCWVENLCELMDALSSKYGCTEEVLKNIWKYQAFDSPGFCKFVRETGDLNRETFEKYKENGMLGRVTKQTERIQSFAYAEDEEIDECYRQALVSEEKDFEKLCDQNLKEIEDRAKGQELWIYGAGKGGEILAKSLRRQNIFVNGFLDKNAGKIKNYEGLPVRTVEAVDPENCFVIISLLYWKPFIVKTLLERGIERNNIFYMCMEREIV